MRVYMRICVCVCMYAVLCRGKKRSVKTEPIYLTFDIDWAHDEIVAALLDRLERVGLPATVFITHNSKLLARMRANPLLELGIHPNFRPLLRRGAARPDDPAAIVCGLKELVPEAVSVRAHALIDGSDLRVLYAACGFTHDANVFVPWTAGLALTPYRCFSGLTRAPYFYEDDVHCLLVDEGRAESWRAGPLLDRPGLKIFNFHPIHLFLNTESLGRYEAARPFFQNPPALAAHVNPSADEGCAAFLDNLLNEAAYRGLGFGRIREIEAGS